VRFTKHGYVSGVSLVPQILHLELFSEELNHCVGFLETAVAQSVEQLATGSTTEGSELE
jgi:hypothetical protein